MNKAMLMGRLTRDPEIRHTAGDNSVAVARYTLAVDRWTKEGSTADFIPCKAFDKKAEFAERYLRKGMKIVVVGKIQTDSYTNAEGKKVGRFEIIVEECEFAESRQSAAGAALQEGYGQAAAGFMDIPDSREGGISFK